MIKTSITEKLFKNNKINTIKQISLFNTQLSSLIYAFKTSFLLRHNICLLGELNRFTSLTITRNLCDGMSNNIILQETLCYEIYYCKHCLVLLFTGSKNQLTTTRYRLILSSTKFIISHKSNTFLVLAIYIIGSVD